MVVVRSDVNLGLGNRCDFVNEPCHTKTDSGSEIPRYSKAYATSK
jgi:hypothetical protein